MAPNPGKRPVDLACDLLTDPEDSKISFEDGLIAETERTRKLSTSRGQRPSATVPFPRQDFIPYPLPGLKAHLTQTPSLQYMPFYCCPICRGKREAHAHVRKLFLVAERLMWEEGLVSMSEKNRNAYFNKQVNDELGVPNPTVSCQEYFPGGRHSQTNRHHPYRNEHEMRIAFNHIHTQDNLTEAVWSLWISSQLDIENLLAEDRAAGTLLPGGNARGWTGSTNMASHDHASAQPDYLSGLPTPPISSMEEARRMNSIFNSPVPAAQQSQFTVNSANFLSHSDRTVSYRTLQDSYFLLDRIERTSYVAAIFIEAYAERLRLDKCRDCWHKQNVGLDGL
ncbi:hypothetical protein BKA58DRAFT_389807 [Alternaria rosae]|uniref:uncharacterized protein n=1 Tax=Alternaria rosae TaxID=1187941 RepID=UPI001E8EAF47|nr:uncharacterized protein BKA58DRAFT_389807 [Alternaria rosae]KAH6865612.1 hypothetical protein BKA58DRAFT_389807 [Alternaria rosae]